MMTGAAGAGRRVASAAAAVRRAASLFHVTSPSRAVTNVAATATVHGHPARSAAAPSARNMATRRVARVAMIAPGPNALAARNPVSASLATSAPTERSQAAVSARTVTARAARSIVARVKRAASAAIVRNSIGRDPSDQGQIDRDMIAQGRIVRRDRPKAVVGRANSTARGPIDQALIGRDTIARGRIVRRDQRKAIAGRANSIVRSSTARAAIGLATTGHVVSVHSGTSPARTFCAGGAGSTPRSRRRRPGWCGTCRTTGSRRSTP